jgi:hypothetical protein
VLIAVLSQPLSHCEAYAGSLTDYFATISAKLTHVYRNADFASAVEKSRMSKN